MRMTSLYTALALVWFLGTTLFHESFSNNVYVPLREWTGPLLMEYLTAAGITAAMLWLMRLGRLYVARKEPLARLRWTILLLLAVAGVMTLMVTNIEIVHYLQYFVLAALLRLAGVSEPTAYLAALLGSLLDESRQYLLHPRFTGYLDWNDLLLNNIGAALGLLLTRNVSARTPRTDRLLRRGTLAAAGLLGLLFATGLLTSRIVFYATLPPGAAPTAFPLADGRQVLALSLKGELQPTFWTQGPLEQRFHVLGVGEGLLLTPFAAFLIWRLTRRPGRGLPLLVLSASLCWLLGPQSLQAAELTACRTDKSPVIDGLPNEQAWQRARWTGAFHDMVDGSAPWLRTEAALLWDERALYVAVRMEEPRLEAFITERDGPVYRDKDFELFIAGRDAYWELEVNARNTLYDVFWIWRDALGPDKRYNPSDWDASTRRIMTLRGIGEHVHPRGERIGFIDADMPETRTAVSLEGTCNTDTDIDRGWTLEIIIPWKALEALRDNRALPPRPGDIWRMNLSRFATRDRSGKLLPSLRPAGWTLTRHGIFDSHMPERFAVVRFEHCKQMKP